jgi:hypothetical protein
MKASMLVASMFSLQHGTETTCGESLHLRSPLRFRSDECAPKPGLLTGAPRISTVGSKSVPLRHNRSLQSSNRSGGALNGCPYIVALRFSFWTQGIVVTGPLRFRRLAVPQTSWNPFHLPPIG